MTFKIGYEIMVANRNMPRWEEDTDKLFAINIVYIINDNPQNKLAKNILLFLYFL